MSITTTSTTPAAWSPDLRGFPADETVPDALVLQTSVVAGQIEGDAPALRVPYVADDGQAGFVPEGQPIPESEADLSEVVVRTGKVAVLGRFSREQLEQPDAAALVVASMQRAVVARANEAYLGSPADPAGLLHVPGVVDGGTIGADLDPLAAAVETIETAGGQATHVVAHPSAWGHLARVKAGDGSAVPLLGAGTEAAQRRILGVDVLTTPAMPTGQLLVLDQNAIVSAVGPVRVDRSADAYFAADSIGVRVTFRLGWAAMRPDRIVRLDASE